MEVIDGKTFQFPSNGIGFPNSDGWISENMLFDAFQFPSNGIGFPNSTPLEILAMIAKVSIPFKRDRLSEQPKQMLASQPKESVFQFPSNGIGFPN